MKDEIAKLWTEALLSGEYEQTNGRLHRPGDGFCCLGVLCDLYRRDQAIPPETFWKHSSAKGESMDVQDTGVWGNLPDDVQVWSGMRSKLGQPPNGDYVFTIYRSLAEANDSLTSFKEIAQYISEHREEL